MIPCYVSGKGMFATATTHAFKVAIIQLLEESGLGYDTRYRYYRQQFPALPSAELARLVCDPIEYYDRDWPLRDGQTDPSADADERVAAFFLERDHRFRAEAKAAIYCFDEAGFGSGVNAMRFLMAGKPILGFLHRRAEQTGFNVGNVLQLALAYPELLNLHRYTELKEIIDVVPLWLRRL
jgi:hypothetical protein